MARIPELDEELGGFPHNLIILWEIDPWISFHEYSLAVAPALASFLAKNRPCALLPSAGVTWRDIRDLYARYYGIPESRLSKLLKIFMMRPIEAEQPPYVRLLRGRSWQEAFEEVAGVVHSLVRERGPFSPPDRGGYADGGIRRGDIQVLREVGSLLQGDRRAGHVDS
jgi:hypothetical protein